MNRADVQQLATRISRAVDEAVARHSDPEPNLFLLPAGSYVLERHDERFERMVVDGSANAVLRITVNPDRLTYTLLVNEGERHILTVPRAQARKFTHHLEGAYLIDAPESATTYQRLVIGH